MKLLYAQRVAVHIGQTFISCTQSGYQSTLFLESEFLFLSLRNGSILYWIHLSVRLFVCLSGIAVLS